MSYSVWTFYKDGKTISLGIDNRLGSDTFVITVDRKIVARYNEKTKEWLGFVNGKLVKYPMPSLQEIAGAFID